MSRNYSSNHPAVRAKLDNYNTPYMEPTIRERREAVRKRIGSRNNDYRGLAWAVGVSLFLAMGFVEKRLAWAVICMGVALILIPSLLERLDR